MPTDNDIPEASEPAPDAAVRAPRTGPVPDLSTATARASRPPDEAPRDETATRLWEGLAPDAMILAPAFGPPPMRCPDDRWAMLVTAVELIGDAEPDRAGEVALLVGVWVPQQPPADSLYDGDLVERLTDPTYPVDPTPVGSTRRLPRDHAADVEMLLAYRGRWRRVGQWCGIDEGWPRVVAPRRRRCDGSAH